MDERQHYTLRFAEKVRGLSVGALVDFRGITIGEVIAIQPQLNPTAPTSACWSRCRCSPAACARREQVRLPAGDDAAMTRPSVRLSTSRRQGLRAQLRNGNLVTGQLYVALDFFPGAGVARPDWSRQPALLPPARAASTNCRPP